MSAESRGRILIVDDEPGMREVLSVLLKRAQYDVETASSGRRALQRISRSRAFDVIVTDLVMPGADGMEVLTAAKAKCAETQVLMITAHGSKATAIEALRGGAYDYVLKPFKMEEIRLLVARAVEKRRLLRENTELRRKMAGRFEVSNIVATSQAMRRIVELCRRMGVLRTNVLITGESGTGKELVARALHTLGSRASGPFVSVNCGALPENLMESELFGHERGAFTGAVRRSEGLFREADGGTLFLDEIGELPAHVQVKLLRAIQEREVRPVGATSDVSIDVRIVAASNRDLETDVDEGRFRSDLFYRLNVVRIDVPPLRSRREDIPVLIDHFLERYSTETGRGVLAFSPPAMKHLMDYEFPGNVRELENIIERAVALASDEVLGPENLPSEVRSGGGPARQALAFPPEGVDLDDVLGEIEGEYISVALERTGGVQKRAAELLGLSFRSLRYRIQKLGSKAGPESK